MTSSLSSFSSAELDPTACRLAVTVGTNDARGSSSPQVVSSLFTTADASPPLPPGMAARGALGNGALYDENEVGVDFSVLGQMAL